MKASDNKQVSHISKQAETPARGAEPCVVVVNYRTREVELNCENFDEETSKGHLEWIR
jgi:hypothetical protein